MTTPQRICSICDIPIHAQPTAFHPDGPAEGKQRWAHLSCASKHKAAQAEAAERLAKAGPAMLAALEALVNDTPYVSMADDCECGDFEENGSCVHTRAHAAIALARGEGT